MNRLLFIGLVFSLVGCASAKLIESRYEPVKSGVVKYKEALLGSVTSAEKAQGLMTDFCAPARYIVVNESKSEETTGYNSNTSGNATSQHTSVSAMSQEYTFVHFRCDSPAKKKN